MGYRGEATSSGVAFRIAMVPAIGGISCSTLWDMELNGARLSVIEAHWHLYYNSKYYVLCATFLGDMLCSAPQN